MANDLKVLKLNQILDNVIDYRGKTPKKLGGDWSKQGYRTLSALNVKSDGLGNVEKIRFLDESMYKKWMKEEVKRGDILLTSEAPSGQVLFWDSDEKIVLGQRLFCLRINDNHDARFIAYYLKSEIGQKVISDKMTGSTVSGISAKMFDHISVITFDTREEESKIAEVLSALDDKIILNNKINDELERTSRLLYDYWFMQFEFPDENGKPYKSSGGAMVYNSQLKRDVPVGWESVKLESLLLRVPDKSNRIESKDILETGRHPVMTQDTGEFISGFTDEPSPINKYPVIIFGDHSCTLRYVNFPFFRGADGTQLLYFDHELTAYVYVYLTKVISQIPNFGKYERHFKYLKDFEVLVPDLNTLSKFNSILKPMFAQSGSNYLEDRKLAELRDWLLPMLITRQAGVH